MISILKYTENNKIFVGSFITSESERYIWKITEIDGTKCRLKLVGDFIDKIPVLREENEQHTISGRWDIENLKKVNLT